MLHKLKENYWILINLGLKFSKTVFTIILLKIKKRSRFWQNKKHFCKKNNKINILAGLVELESESVELKSADRAFVIANPQIGASRVKAKCFYASGNFLQTVLVDNNTGGEVVDLNKALRVDCEYHVFVQRLEATAQNLNRSN